MNTPALATALLLSTCSLATLAGQAPSAAPAAAPATAPAPTAPAPTAPAPSPTAAASEQFILGESKVVAEGFQFTEGPIWVKGPDNKGGVLLFSDIPANTVFRLAPGGKAEPVRKPSGRANGNAIDADGTVVSAESDGRITRWSLPKAGETVAPDAVKASVLAQALGEDRLNSPNDLVILPGGRIVFTDPAYFVPRDARKLKFEGVFVLAPGGELKVVSEAYKRPNGVATSPDGKRIYVADAGAREIWSHEVAADGTIGERKLLCKLPEKGRGVPDGLKTDREGRIYTTGPGGLYVLDTQGAVLQHVPLQGCTNVAFGGDDGKTLYVTASRRVLAFQTKVAGW